ncbi:hypothetical protein [Arcanobacterium buesumense]|uniref:hypothetical protein n=1 Tax=Arcanobacterium buesumense TaxID=2722751 RepID=UPI001B3AB982|nr:hypothetical protein [Arcanobacterium buesumense]
MYERNQFELLTTSGLLVELGGIGWIARNYVLTETQRAGLIGAIHGSKVIVSHVGAYWIYTGKTSIELTRSIHLMSHPDMATTKYPRQIYPVTDLVMLGSTTLTTKERTAIDLLRSDLATGVEALLNLLRHGASFDQIVERANRLRYHPRMRGVRDLLYQLPDAVIAQASSHYVAE